MPINPEDLSLNELRTICQNLAPWEALTADDCQTIKKWISATEKELDAIYAMVDAKETLFGRAEFLKQYNRVLD